MTVTIRDVAQRAGVSPATAARALGGYGYVGDDARQRVNSAAGALGYLPNNVARTLASGTSNVIGLIAGDIENSFFATRGAGAGRRRRGVRLHADRCQLGRERGERTSRPGLPAGEPGRWARRRPGQQQ